MTSRFGDNSDKGLSEDQKRVGRMYVAGAGVTGAGIGGVGVRRVVANRRAKSGMNTARADFNAAQNRYAAETERQKKYGRRVAALYPERKAQLEGFNPRNYADPGAEHRRLKAAMLRSKAGFDLHLRPLVEEGRKAEVRESIFRHAERKSRHGGKLVAAGVGIPLAALATRKRVAETWGRPDRRTVTTTPVKRPDGFSNRERTAFETNGWNVGVGRKVFNPDAGPRGAMERESAAARAQRQMSSSNAKTARTKSLAQTKAEAKRLSQEREAFEMRGGHPDLRSDEQRRADHAKAMQAGR